MKCETCEHKEVCSKMTAYADAFNSCKTHGEFEVEVKCKWYRMIQAISRTQVDTGLCGTGVTQPQLGRGQL